MKRRTRRRKDKWRDEDRKWRRGCTAVMSSPGGYWVAVVVGVSQG